MVAFFMRSFFTSDVYSDPCLVVNKLKYSQDRAKCFIDRFIGDCGLLDLFLPIPSLQTIDHGVERLGTMH